MPRIIIQNHAYNFQISDVLRLFYGNAIIEDDIVRTKYDDGITVISSISDGMIATEWEIDGKPFSISRDQSASNPKREVKRQLYFALQSLTGISFPWGSLTGIRPTIIAKESNFDKSILTGVYFVSETKAAIAVAAARQEQLLENTIPGDSVHCYIGIPFCMTRCSYCSFLSGEYAVYEKWVEKYIEALIFEIDTFIPLMKNRIMSIYIGGGTPSVIHEVLLEKLLSSIARFYPDGDYPEYTFEAGRADSITDTKLILIKKYGVNRICLNPQTMNDLTLERIGRRHTSDEVLKSYEMIVKYKFKTVNMDVIAGLPGEVLEDFKRTLDKIIDLNPENITVHSLSLKKTSEFTRQKKEDEENTLNPQIFNKPCKILSDMIEYSQNRLEANGYLPYYLYRQKDTIGGQENTGYSKPGHCCIYNVAMMGDKTSVLGLGAKAVSKKVIDDNVTSGIERFANIRDIILYIKGIQIQIDKKLKFFKLQENENVKANDKFINK